MKENGFPAWEQGMGCEQSSVGPRAKGNWPWFPEWMEPRDEKDCGAALQWDPQAVFKDVLAPRVM